MRQQIRPGGRQGRRHRLTPCFDEAAPYYEQARLVFLCRKLYRQDLEEGCFLDKGLLEKWYDNDLHRMFIGEIVKVLEKE